MKGFFANLAYVIGAIVIIVWGIRIIMTIIYAISVMMASLIAKTTEEAKP